MGNRNFFVGGAVGRMVAVAETIRIQKNRHFGCTGIVRVIDIFLFGDFVKEVISLIRTAVYQLVPAVAYHIGTGFSAAYLGVDIFSVFVLKQIDAVKFIPRVIRAHIAEKGGGYIHQRADFVRFLGSVIRMMDHEWNMAGGVHHGSFADGIVVTHHIAVVKGLTTAATVWCAAAIGGLCGFGMFAEAVMGTIAIMTVNLFFKHLRGERHEENANHENHHENSTD